MPTPRFCPLCATPLQPRQAAGRLRQVCPAQACAYVHYSNPTPVVAALVEHQGDVLLVRNAGWPEKWYGLVTGFLEEGETPEQGVLRELHEELGLDGTVVGLIGVYPFEMRNELIVAYHVRATGEVVVGQELEAFKRVHPNDLRPWPLATGIAVKDWLEARQKLAP